MFDPSAAITYNVSQAGKLYRMRDLPEFLRQFSARSVKFANAVEEYQRSRGLKADGCLGPKTLAALRAGAVVVAPPPEPPRAKETPAENPMLPPDAWLAAVLRPPTPLSGSIRVYGQDVAIDGCRIVRFDEPNSFSFYEDPASFKPRTRKANVTVWHDSVTQDAKSCYQVLRHRKKDDGSLMHLSTHFIIDVDGVIYQCLDPKDVGRHAGGERPGWNAASVGIDIANPLDPSLDGRGRVLRPVSSWSPRKGYWDLTSAQIFAARKLKDTLVKALPIADDCPRTAAKLPVYMRANEYLAPLDPTTYSGSVSHAQISKSRYDGNDALSWLFGEFAPIKESTS